MPVQLADRTATRAEAAAAGTGVLEFARHDGRTVVSRAFAASPLRFLAPRNHGRGAWVYVASYGGGLVDGDALRLSIEAERDAVALLSTQASTKVYRSAGTSVTVHAVLHSESTLVCAPDPVVCFAHATYVQTQRFELAAGANLVFVDWLTSGRHAAGERWAFDTYRSSTSVHRDRRLLVHDALALRASDGDLRVRLGRFDVLGVVMLIGPALREHVVRILAQVADTPVARHADMRVAATPIGDDGAIVRVAGTSLERAAAAIRGFLSFVPGLLGDDPWSRRY